VEQYGSKTLHEHRASLEQKARFSDFRCALRYLPTEITQELASWCAKYAQYLNGDRFNIIILNVLRVSCSGYSSWKRTVPECSVTCHRNEQCCDVRGVTEVLCWVKRWNQCFFSVVVTLPQKKNTDFSVVALCTYQITVVLPHRCD